jgi:hypothetical protein
MIVCRLRWVNQQWGSGSQRWNLRRRDSGRGGSAEYDSRRVRHAIVAFRSETCVDFCCVTRHPVGKCVYTVSRENVFGEDLSGRYRRVERMRHVVAEPNDEQLKQPCPSPKNAADGD